MQEIPKQQPQVARQMEKLEIEISALQSILGCLADRLPALLRPVLPSPSPVHGNDEQKTEEQLVPLAAKLSAMHFEVAVMGNAINDILSRLEL